MACTEPSACYWALLQDPVVAVRITEEDEGVPVAASPLNPDSLVHVLDRAGLYAPLDQFTRAVSMSDTTSCKPSSTPGGMLRNPVLR